MGTNWNLNDLYKGFDQEFQNDLKKLSDLVDSYAAFLEAGPKSDKDYVEGDIKFDEELTVLVRGLASFASLTQSTDVSNNEALGYLSKISGIMRKLTAPSVKFSRYLATVDLDKL